MQYCIYFVQWVIYATVSRMTVHKSLFKKELPKISAIVFAVTLLWWRGKSNWGTQGTGNALIDHHKLMDNRFHLYWPLQWGCLNITSGLELGFESELMLGLVLGLEPGFEPWLELGLKLGIGKPYITKGLAQAPIRILWGVGVLSVASFGLYNYIQYHPQVPENQNIISLVWIIWEKRRCQFPLLWDACYFGLNCSTHHWYTCILYHCVLHFTLYQYHIYYRFHPDLILIWMYVPVVSFVDWQEEHS